MLYKDCDELSSNLRDAENLYRVCMDFVTCERLIEYVCERYGKSTLDFEVQLDDALDSENLEDLLREAYKSLLGVFFNTRAQFKRREMNKVPFSPR
jgi:hypothetical protein